MILHFFVYCPHFWTPDASSFSYSLCSVHSPSVLLSLRLKIENDFCWKYFGSLQGGFVFCVQLLVFLNLYSGRGGASVRIKTQSFKDETNQNILLTNHLVTENMWQGNLKCKGLALSRPPRPPNPFVQSEGRGIWLWHQPRGCPASRPL